MATRTVHRGSRGRFAGAKAGKAETVKVGSGYARANGGAQVAGSPRGRRSVGKKLGITALGRGVRKASRNPNVQGAVFLGAAVGLQYGVNRSIDRAARRSRNARNPLQGGTPWTGQSRAFRQPVNYRGVPTGGIRLGAPGNARPMGSSLLSGARPMPAGPTRRSSSASSARPPSPNYGAAAGRREFVGRRVTDGNWGLKLG